MISINENDLHTLWYENTKGDKWIPPGDYCGTPDPPKGFVYQVSEFPFMLRRSYLKLVQESEVDSCEHLEEHIKYWHADGSDKRECRHCSGTQSKFPDEQWPNEWCACGSRDIAHGHSSWSSDLVLVLSRPGFKEKAKSIIRGYFNNKIYSLNNAIKIAANSCERCMNFLAYKYGLDWGYKEGFDEWAKCGTRCSFCESENS